MQILEVTVLAAYPKVTLRLSSEIDGDPSFVETYLSYDLTAHLLLYFR